MKVASYFITALVAAVLVISPIAGKMPKICRDFAVLELIHTGRIVEKELKDISDRLGRQLEAFGEAVSRDIDFSMKLLVENDRTAPEVTEMAQRFMGVMDLSVLDIIDANGTVVSSGQFPASAGNKAGLKYSVLENGVSFIIDDIKGEDAMTLQSKVKFTCSDVPFMAVGGFLVDSEFLSGLLPRKGVSLILKIGNEIIGMDNIQTISDISSDNTVMINDTVWLASSIPVSSGAGTKKIELLLLMPQPPKLSWTALFR